MGPIEHTRWQLETPLTAQEVMAALVDFTLRANGFEESADG